MWTVIRQLLWKSNKNLRFSPNTSAHKGLNHPWNFHEINTRKTYLKVLERTLKHPWNIFWYTHIPLRSTFLLDILKNLREKRVKSTEQTIEIIPFLSCSSQLKEYSHMKSGTWYGAPQTFIFSGVTSDFITIWTFKWSMTRGRLAKMGNGKKLLSKITQSSYFNFHTASGGCGGNQNKVRNHPTCTSVGAVTWYW